MSSLKRRNVANGIQGYSGAPPPLTFPQLSTTKLYSNHKGTYCESYFCPFEHPISAKPRRRDGHWSQLGYPTLSIRRTSPRTAQETMHARQSRAEVAMPMMYQTAGKDQSPGSRIGRGRFTTVPGRMIRWPFVLELPSVSRTYSGAFHVFLHSVHNARVRECAPEWKRRLQEGAYAVSPIATGPNVYQWKRS